MQVPADDQTTHSPFTLVSFKAEVPRFCPLGSAGAKPPSPRATCGRMFILPVHQRP